MVVGPDGSERMCVVCAGLLLSAICYDMNISRREHPAQKPNASWHFEIQQASGVQDLLGRKHTSCGIIGNDSSSSLFVFEVRRKEGRVHA